MAASDSSSDSDNFSVEFEVESVDSDDYNEDDASVSADDQVKRRPTWTEFIASFISVSSCLSHLTCPGL